jgi:hypothetical protein
MRAQPLARGTQAAPTGPSSVASTATTSAGYDYASLPAWPGGRADESGDDAAVRPDHAAWAREVLAVVALLLTAWRPVW